MKKLIFLVMLVVAAGVSASASPVFLTPGETASFTFVSTTGPGFQTYQNLGGGNYSAQWNQGADGSAVTATSQLILGAARGVAGDTFDLVITNNNGNPWNFSVSINNGAQTIGPTLINNNGGSFTFSFVLPAGGLSQISIIVGQTLPIAGVDRGAEYQVSSVPEPTSMFLLGTGLVGLAGAARRKFRSKAKTDETQA